MISSYFFGIFVMFLVWGLIALISNSPGWWIPEWVSCAIKCRRDMKAERRNEKYNIQFLNTVSSDIMQKMKVDLRGSDVHYREYGRAKGGLVEDLKTLEKRVKELESKKRGRRPSKTLESQ